MEIRRSLVLGGAMASLLLGGVAAAQDAPDPAAERERLARLAYIDAETALDSGMAQPELVYQWSLRWLDAQRERTPSDQGAALQAHLERMRGLQHKVHAQIASGVQLPTMGTMVGFYVAEGEVWVGRGKR